MAVFTASTIQIWVANRSAKSCVIAIHIWWLTVVIYFAVWRYLAFSNQLITQPPVRTIIMMFTCWNPSWKAYPIIWLTFVFLWTFVLRFIRSAWNGRCTYTINIKECTWFSRARGMTVILWNTPSFYAMLMFLFTIFVMFTCRFDTSNVATYFTAITVSIFIAAVNTIEFFWIAILVNRTILVFVTFRLTTFALK